MRGRKEPSDRPEGTLDAREAIGILSIKASSFYAYVSRGLIRSYPGEGRSRRYSKADVYELRLKNQAGSAATALSWGQPVLESSITEITPQGPKYRGALFSELVARGASFESVAELLWTRQRRSLPVTWTRAADPAGDSLLRSLLQSERGAPLHRVQAALAITSLREESEDPGFDVALQTARQNSLALATSFALMRHWSATERLLRKGDTRISRLLGEAFGLGPEHDPLLDAALVISADHELNTSAFTARVAASNGASLLDCLMAAIASHSGSRQGGAILGLEKRLQSLRGARDYASFRAYVHPFYPEGDPRAPVLLGKIDESGLRSRKLKALLAQGTALEETSGAKPSLDFALLALAYAVGEDATFGQMAYLVGRSAGWIAHVLEQRSLPGQIRPRARFRP